MVFPLILVLRCAKDLAYFAGGPQDRLSVIESKEQSNAALLKGKRMKTTTEKLSPLLIAN
jgi:hypothetical protein